MQTPSSRKKPASLFREEMPVFLLLNISSGNTCLLCSDFLRFRDVYYTTTRNIRELQLAPAAGHFLYNYTTTRNIRELQPYFPTALPCYNYTTTRNIRELQPCTCTPEEGHHYTTTRNIRESKQPYLGCSNEIRAGSPFPYLWRTFGALRCKKAFHL